MKSVWPQEISPIVLGHEGAGVVVAVGDDVKTVRTGDHVVLSYRSCGSCSECAVGHQPYCRNFRSLNGIGTRVDGSMTMRRNGSAVYGSYFGQSSFASHALAYESNVVVIDDDARPDRRGAAGLRRADRRGHRPGRAEARRRGVAGRVRRRRRRALGGDGRQRHRRARRRSRSTPWPVAASSPLELGASATIDPTSEDVVDAIRGLTGAGATHAIDTSAKGAVINQAIEALAPRGTLALLGIGIPEFQMDVRSVISGGKTLRGVIEGDAVPQEFIPRLIGLHRDGQAAAREADPHLRIRADRRRVRRRRERRGDQAGPHIF